MPWGRQIINMKKLASIEKPWMKYYPEEAKTMTIPEVCLYDYIKSGIKDMEETAIHFYGADISWNVMFQNIESTAKALKAIGFKKGDQIPVFLQSVPEFIYLLLGAEKIGASIVCRDGSIEENVDAVKKANARIIFAHDFLSREEEIVMNSVGVEKIVLIPPFNSAKNVPAYIASSITKHYKENACNKNNITWKNFIKAGRDFVVSYSGSIHEPLFRCYTTGTTGTSKQVLHSANSMIGILHQMKLYASLDFKFSWLVMSFPPSLVACVLSMMLSPLTSGKLLILDPFVEPEDIDLSLMLYKPNGTALIPMFVNIVMKSERIPDDYDMSHLFAVGAGCEFCNDKQIEEIQSFLVKHNSMATFTTGYGMSEAGSNCTFSAQGVVHRNFCHGIPMPMTTLAVFKEGTDEELGYDELGEICKCGPGNMIGYDDEVATKKVLIKHKDGKIWLHTGDIGYITKDGHIHVLNRGFVKHISGDNLFISEMENKIVGIKGIKDAFFITVKDEQNEGYFVPHLYLVLEELTDLMELRRNIWDALQPHERPAKMFILDERPYFHFKTARKLLAKM